MRFCGVVLWLGLVAGVAAQTVTLSVENPAAKVMPVVPPDRVVIKIGDLQITAAEFDQMIDTLPENMRPIARGGGRKQFAENLVRMLVLAQEGRRRKIDERPAYQTQKMFAESNMLAGLTQEDLKKNAQIEETEVRQYWEKHRLEFERVRVRHVLIRMHGSPLPVTPGQADLSEAEALAKAQEVRKRILNGEDFADVVRAESNDTETLNTGGDMGFIHRGQRLPSFEEAAFALKVGEVSEPVKTEFGYHIIRVEAKESKTFEEVRPELERKMRPEWAQRTIEELATKSGAALDPEFFGIAKK